MHEGLINSEKCTHLKYPVFDKDLIHTFDKKIKNVIVPINIK